MSQATPPGWYPAPGDPPGTHRYWDGRAWTTGPQPMTGGPQPPVGSAGPYGASGFDLLPGGRTLAEPGQRIVARLIDALIGFAIALVIVLAFGVDDVVRSPAFLVAGAAVGLAYEVVMVALKGGTLGKLIMGIGVQTHAGTYPPGWQPAFMRWLPSVAGYIPFIGFIFSLLIAILSLVWLFQDPRRQTVYDKFAKTYVVKTK